MNELEQIEGIGPKTSELLAKLNIHTIEDLINHYPFRYEVLKRSKLDEIKDRDKIIIDGIIEGQPTIIYINPKLKKIIFRINTGRNMLNVTIYNQVYLMETIKSGKFITVIGRYDKIKNTVIASDIRMERLPAIPKIESIYYTTSGLSKKSISRFITALIMGGYKPKDILPEYIIDKYDFPSKYEAICEIHNPTDELSLKKARQRIKYEELFMYLLKINYLKEKMSHDELAIKRTIDHGKLDKFIASLPYELTIDQKTAVDEIVTDLESDKRMNRLLQGDVGSGKTIVALISAYANYLAGYQTAIMVPTEILANQHYSEAANLFKKFKVNVSLLTSSTKNKDKEKILEDLSQGKIDLIIGTQSLIGEKIVFKNLGLVITDEQHRFGVNQRSNLKNKGIKPDVLYMSATPIPRTYALTIYGDMDVSIIKEMPKGRLPVKTKVFKTSEMKKVYSLMNDELVNNHQIYVIAPLIEENEELDLTNVYTLRDKMNLIFGNKYKIDIVHGKMKSKEKDLIMEEFKQNDVNILISTTVIEVGVDVPNASMMVIFDANRFGLSTLHQLRGRVGRGSVESTCILISKTETERLNILSSTNDGFVIAEEDFKLRGSGDLFGTKQSGDMNFKIANLKEDYKILVEANKDAKEFWKKTDPEYEDLRQLIINSISTN
jgi:ATP-dependent DNA helicase RecG